MKILANSKAPRRKNQVAPAELRMFYSRLKKILLQNSRRLLRTKAKIWVLPSAILAMQNCARLVGFEEHTMADLETEKYRQSLD